MCENRAKCEGAREHASAPKALERAERPEHFARFSHTAPRSPSSLKQVVHHVISTSFQRYKRVIFDVIYRRHSNVRNAPFFVFLRDYALKYVTSKSTK